MQAKLKLAAMVGIPLLALGWALFRPELIFVNTRVNESKTAGRVLEQGSFVSYAHETTGEASIIDSGSQKILRLENFSTSNGPDVRVYLVKGSDSSADGLKNGFVDLGSIKGNLGSQNYLLPAGIELKEYAAVAIWCKRFSVGFGGATLVSSKEQGSQGA
jgi:Electron transfer DM13